MAVKPSNAQVENPCASSSASTDRTRNSTRIPSIPAILEWLNSLSAHDRPVQLANALRQPHPHWAAHLLAFRNEGAGLNMSLKTVAYTVKVIAASNMVSEPATLTRANNLGLAATECRSYLGYAKHFESYRSVVQQLGVLHGKYVAPLLAPMPLPAAASTALVAAANTAAVTKASTPPPPPLTVLFREMVTVVITFCRGNGQLAGDVMLTLRYVLTALFTTQFDRALWHYRFWKFWAQGFSAVLDVMKLTETLKCVQSVASARAARRRASAATAATEMSDKPASPTISTQEMQLRRSLRLTLLGLTRNVCDMLVYFVWNPRYVPPAWLIAWAGLASGLIGVYFCWTGCAVPVVHPADDDDEDDDVPCSPAA